MDIWFRGIGCEFENKGFGLGIFYYPDIKTVSIELLLWAIYISKVPEEIKEARRLSKKLAENAIDFHF